MAKLAENRLVFGFRRTFWIDHLRLLFKQQPSEDEFSRYASYEVPGLFDLVRMVHGIAPDIFGCNGDIRTTGNLGISFRSFQQSVEALGYSGERSGTLAKT